MSGFNLAKTQRAAVVRAFHRASAARLRRVDCYQAATDFLQDLFPESPRPLVAAEAVRIVTHDPSYSETLGSTAVQRHVLVIEDDLGVQDVLREMIEDEGFRVSVAADMTGAREVLDRGGVVLMVSDEILPRVAGLSGAEEARVRKTPVIVMTANLEKQAELREKGIDFMPKPFRLAELHRRIDELVGRNELAERHARESPR